MSFTFAWGFVAWAVFVHVWSWAIAKALFHMHGRLRPFELALRYLAQSGGFSIGAVTFYPVDTVGGIVFSMLAGLNAWLARLQYRRAQQVASAGRRRP